MSNINPKADFNLQNKHEQNSLIFHYCTEQPVTPPFMMPTVLAAVLK